MSGSPSPEAREDYNLLLDALMPFAEELLRKHGEFFPFGAAVSTAGEVAAHAGYTGDEMPPSEEVIDVLVRGLQAEAHNGQIRASGICYDGRILHEGKKVDVVIVSLEHTSGNASKVCVPYTKNLFGKYRFGDTIGALEEPRVFAPA